MKKYLIPIVLLGLLLFAPQAHAQQILSGIMAGGGGSIKTIEGVASSSAITDVSSETINVTTSGLNRVLILVSTLENDKSFAMSVSGVSGSGGVGAFTNRSSQIINSSSAHYQDNEVWWAIAPTAGTYTLTVTYSGTIDDGCLLAFAVAGANTSTPWDVNASLPKYATNNSGTPSACDATGVSTTSTSPLVFAVYGTGNQGSVSTLTPAGLSAFTGMPLENGGATYSQIMNAAYQIETSALSNVTVGWTDTTSYWVLIVDAIQ